MRFLLKKINILFSNPFPYTHTASKDDIDKKTT
jgi:hypothetical protein